MSDRKSYLAQVLYLLGEDRRRLPGIGLAILGSSVLDTVGIGLIGPFVAIAAKPALIDEYPVRRTIEGVLGPSDSAAIITWLGIGLVALFAVKAGFVLGTQYLLARFARGQQLRLRARLLRHYQSMPYSEHLLGSSAESIQVILTHVNAFSGPCLLILMRLVAEGCVALSLLAMLAWADWVTVVVLLTLLSIVGLIYDRVFRRKMRTIGRLASDSNVRMVRGVQQAFEGMKEIRVLGREAYFQEEVLAGSRDFALATTHQQIIQVLPRYLTETVLFTFVVGVVLVAQARGHDLQSVAPLLAMYGVAGLRILPSTNLLLSGLNQLRFARYPVDCLYTALRRLESMPPSGSPRLPPSEVRPFEVLELRGVRYRYPKAAVWALDGIDLQVRRGESIGLVGSSGAGKTTLLDVLLGLLDAQEGEVRLNGRPLRDDTAAWLHQVGYLPQSVFLIDASLRANVALGVPEAEIDDTRIDEAIRQARLTELVAQLPEGIRTEIGERGVRLSGGQRQRIALARAFYHGRDVLLMDEATSALDSETERQIVDEIRHLRGRKTIIVIAHRLTTVEHCDRVYRLERGAIVQSGTFAEVVRSAQRPTAG